MASTQFSFDLTLTRSVGQWVNSGSIKWQGVGVSIDPSFPPLWGGMGSIPEAAEMADDCE